MGRKAEVQRALLEKLMGPEAMGLTTQQLHFTDEESFDPVRTAVTMLVTAKRLYPTLFAWRPDNFIDLLSGSARLRTMIDAGADVDDVIGSWRDELEGFRRQRRRHLIYW